ncbi:hypothetical protein N7492_007576 [Penicillium capsulatum]|uniref:Extracellular membrane protein CFEM domain-containing protein n=1 Tax=Penicillium capsulatum TaxID=69766 RepID=A0A9W9LLT9_9EURO|nr:hypothetical protein N7492_007576 [Penicillium capsulatum]
MRLLSLSLASGLFSVVATAASNFTDSFPHSEICGPDFVNNQTTATEWCQRTTESDKSGCCIVDKEAWNEDKTRDAMQKWCDSIPAKITVESFSCSSNTDPASSFGSLFSDDDDDSYDSTSSWDPLSSSSSSSTDTDSSNSEESNGMSRGAIVGMVLGIIAAVGLFIILGRWLAMSGRSSSSQSPKVTTTWTIPDQQSSARNRPREPASPVERSPTPPPVYSAPPPAYHA